MPQCPTHNLTLEPITGAPVAGGTALKCPTCDYARMPERQRTVVALKLPGIDPGPQHKRVPVKEADLQQGVVQALRLKGYEVIVTSRVRHRWKCGKCGQWGWPQGGDGVSKGLADVLCTREEWALPIWIAIELKGSETAVSPSQRKMADRGLNVIARSIDEVIEAVEDVGNRLADLVRERRGK